MSETFDRPLVIGYLAYDRPISDKGVLGGSQPTLQRMESRPVAASQPTVTPILPVKPRPDVVTDFHKDPNSVAINAWLRQPGNKEFLKLWLTQNNLDPNTITAYLFGDFAALRQRIVDAFKIGDACGTSHQ